MDFSILAGVGSFIVSERVIKAKATALVILLCVVSYDLTIGSHDPDSLPVYRGPVLIGVTMILAATALRSWRRNGVAVDELIFLPGTQYAEKSERDIRLGLSCLPLNLRHNDIETTGTQMRPSVDLYNDDYNSEGEALSWSESKIDGFKVKLTQTNNIDLLSETTTLRDNNDQTNPNNGCGNCDSNYDMLSTGLERSPLRSESKTVSDFDSDCTKVKTTNKTSTNSTLLTRGDNYDSDRDCASFGSDFGFEKDNLPDLGTADHSIGDITKIDSETVPMLSTVIPSKGNDEDSPMGQNRLDLTSQQQQKYATNAASRDWLPQNLGIGLWRRVRTKCSLTFNYHVLRQRKIDDSTSNFQTQTPITTLSSQAKQSIDSTTNNTAATLSFSRGIGKYFTSNNDISETNEYAPSAPSVASAALDLTLPVLFNFHLFMMATKRPSDTQMGIKTRILNSPQILPLIFFSVLMLRSIFPRKSRFRFWNTIKNTITAPFCHKVTFRDAFIGDLLTSMVRPIQDICFALFYYFVSIYGILFKKPEWHGSGSVLMHSLLLHVYILPSCAFLPLFFRFLQTLRQAYDEQKRWPHLGNSFKYLSASLIIFYGMTHKEDRRSKWWFISFIFATLYQIWWDVFMDWELLVLSSMKQQDEIVIENEDASSLDHSAGSVFLSMFRRLFLYISYIVTSVRYKTSNVYNYVRSLKDMKLRSNKLYKSDRYYWKILALNSIFRFAWMMSFIPVYHLNSQTGKVEETFSMNVKAAVGFAASLTEIIRRCWWSVLKVELETIKLRDPEYNLENIHLSAGIKYSQLSPRTESKRTSSFDSSSEGTLNSSNFKTQAKATMKKTAHMMLKRKLFSVELVLWAISYVFLTLWMTSIT